MVCKFKSCPRKRPRCWRNNMAGHSSLRKAMSMAKHGTDGEKHCPSMRLSESTSIHWGSGQLTSIGDLDLRAILKNVDLDPRAVLKKVLRGIDSVIESQARQSWF